MARPKLTQGQRKLAPKSTSGKIAQARKRIRAKHDKQDKARQKDRWERDVQFDLASDPRRAREDAEGGHKMASKIRHDVYKELRQTLKKDKAKSTRSKVKKVQSRTKRPPKGR